MVTHDSSGGFFKDTPMKLINHISKSVRRSKVFPTRMIAVQSFPKAEVFLNSSSDSIIFLARSDILSDRMESRSERSFVNLSQRLFQKNIDLISINFSGLLFGLKVREHVIIISPMRSRLSSVIRILLLLNLPKTTRSL